MKIKTRRYYLYYLLKAGLFILNLLPLKVVLAIAGRGGRIACRMLPKYREIALENLRNSLDLPEEELERIACGVFVNLAKNGAEWIKLFGLRKMDLDKLVTETEGIGLLRSAFDDEKGVILITGHFGNWELGGLYLNKLGYKGAGIARRIYFHKYDELICALRNRYGVSVIYRDQPVKSFFRVLKNGQMLVILADQDIKGVDGVFVDFFGRKCFTPTAPVKFAMATGAKIVLAALVRNDDDTHKFVVRRVFDPASRKDEPDIVAKCTQEWTRAFEDLVRRYPDQWAWIHKRWKTRPDTKDD